MIARSGLRIGARVFGYLVVDARWSFFLRRVYGHDGDCVGDDDREMEVSEYQSM